MKHFILNLLDDDEELAASYLDAKEWPVGHDERHRDALAPGDLVLIHVSRPGRFIGRAELATAVHDRTVPDTQTRPGDRSSMVSLADVEAWPHAVALAVAVSRIDPTGSNPHVQANAAGFRSGVVRITADEYATVVALSREASDA
jgi:hypothetical protein